MKFGFVGQMFQKWEISGGVFGLQLRRLSAKARFDILLTGFVT